MEIGALPTLGTGDIKRSLSQEWARAIYEDDPLGTHADGMKYTSAYNGADALAIWDSATKVRTLGALGADIALNHPAMLTKLKSELSRRRIVVRTITASGCTECREEAARTT